MFWTSPNASLPGPDDDFWYQPVGVHTASGARVTPASALTFPAVYACVKVIAEALMQMPLFLYERLPNGGKERATKHPLYALLHDAPNEHQTSPEWREIMQHHILLRGNAYSEKTIVRTGLRGLDTPIVELGMPHHPDFVKVEKTTTQRGIEYRYIFQDPAGGSDRELRSDQVLHIRGLGLAPDGISGLSPIEIEREAVGLGLSSQDFLARYFANDARPGGWLEHPTNFKDDETKRKFRAAWQDAQTGANRHKTAILEYGMKYTPLELKLVDAQFLGLRKYQNLDIARIYRVPPHLIMELDRATFSNITQQDIEFVKFTLLPWLTRWERRLSLSLLTKEERETLFFEFLVDGLERGDGVARANYYNKGIQDGWLTRNEVRIRENLNPLKGLNEPLEPLNMARAADRDDDNSERSDEDEEQLENLRRNAAEALVRRQMHEMRAADDPVVFLRGDWTNVARLIACSPSQASAYCDSAAEDYVAGEKILNWHDWRARQMIRLMEIR